MTSIIRWRKNYYKSQNEPHDKFNLIIDDPYVTRVSNPPKKKDIEELYEWAMKVSTDFPIFAICGDKHYLNDRNKPEVKKFYFDIYEERFMSKDEIVELAEDYTFKQFLLSRILTKYANNISKQDKNLSEELHGYINKNDLEKVLDLISQKRLSTEHIKIKEGKIHIAPDNAFPECREFLSKNFYNIKADAENMPLKKISKEEEIEEFCRNPDLLACFLKLCKEAAQYHFSESELPKILRDE